MAKKKSSRLPTKGETGVSKETKERFLEWLPKVGMNITAAARNSGLTSPHALYQQRQHDKTFAQAWANIEGEVLDALESDQFEAAKSRGEDRRWVLARLRRNRWGDQKQVQITGEIEHRHVRELTDKELSEIAGQDAIEADYEVRDE